MSNVDYEKELNKEQLSAVKTIDVALVGCYYVGR